MKKSLNLKKAIIPLSAFALLAVATPAFAATQQQVIDLSPVNGVVPSSAVQVSDVIRFIINLLVVIAVIASLVYLIYGGLRWVISGGDKEKVEAARKTVVAAIIGLVVVLLSWVIITVVMQIVTGKALNNFTLPTLQSPNTQTKPQ